MIGRPLGNCEEVKSTVLGSTVQCSAAVQMGGQSVQHSIVQHNTVQYSRFKSDDAPPRYIPRYNLLISVRPSDRVRHPGARSPKTGQGGQATSQVRFQVTHSSVVQSEKNK